MQTFAIGIDPGKTGGMVLALEGRIILKSPCPVTKGPGKKLYSHGGARRWLTECKLKAKENNARIVAGLEESWPIPAKDVLPETAYYQFADDIKLIFSQSKGFSPEARGRFETDAVIERAKGFLKKFFGSRESNTTSFQQGMGVMFWMCHLWDAEIRWEGFSPATWHAQITKGYTGANPKARALAAAERLYPGENFLASDRCRTPHDGIVDAACIAEAARRKFAAEVIPV